METKEYQSNIIKKEEVLERSKPESRYSLYEKVKEIVRFGNWTFTGKFKVRGHSKYASCKCDCGLLKDVLCADLIRGSSLMCRSCAASKRNLKHGQNCHDNITYEYHLWQNLKQQKSLCIDWENNFSLFFKDVGAQPFKDFKLLKKDNNQLLSISNFFWGHKKLKFFDQELKGRKLGLWTVLEEDLIGKTVRWLCECECGRKDYIYQGNLKKGTSTKCKSCSMKGKGPLQKKSGIAAHPLYAIYHGIIRRCYREKEKSYPHYGGRGIKVCKRWTDSIENFIYDMGDRPSSKHSIDRIDVNKGYSPENCKWSTQKEQCNNRRKINDLQMELNQAKMDLEQARIAIRENQHFIEKILAENPE